MALRARLRTFAERLVPGLVAERRRRYGVGLRRRLGVTDLAGEMGSTVVSGPFAGLTYPEGRMAEVDAPVAKLCGVYEQELLPVFESALDRRCRTFIDIGSADGYFAVGIAVASPEIDVWAFDLSRSARDLLSDVARLNRCADRVRVGSRFIEDSLGTISTDAALVLCDIEGAERELLTSSLAEKLRTAEVLVEIHEAHAPGAESAVTRAFSVTHDCSAIEGHARDLAALPVPEQWDGRSRALAVDELRGATGRWLHFTPK